MTDLFKNSLPQPPHTSDHCKYWDSIFSLDAPFSQTCALGIPLSDKVLSEKCMPRQIQASCEQCPMREDHSDAAKAAWKQWLDADTEITFAILRLIPQNGDGEIPCPKCGGTIQYGRAEINGHLHAFCSTDGCFGVMS